MPLKISICCCNNLFGEGIKRLIKEDGPEIDCTINVSSQKEVINAKPDILITDFHALSSMSLDPLFKHKIGILLLWTGCLPRLEDENLLGFISQGVIGILSTEASPSELRKAIKSVASGELWFNRKKLKDILSCVKNVAGEIHQITGKERDVIKMICKGYRNKEIMKSLNMTEQSVKNT